MTTNATENPVHVFEAAGLGKAPFRFVGKVTQDLCYGEAILNRKEYEATGIRATTKPGGTCAFCGTYILHMFDIESADGKKFHVGCDCLEKTGDKGFKKIVAAHKAATARSTKERRISKEAARIAAAEAAVKEGKLGDWAEEPHPYRRAGESLLDYAKYVFENGGHTGKLALTKRVELMLK